jgi:hypothetical protein
VVGESRLPQIFLLAGGGVIAKAAIATNVSSAESTDRSSVPWWRGLDPPKGPVYSAISWKVKSVEPAGAAGSRSMPKSRGRKPKKPRAASPGADRPTGTINTAADGPTGIIDTAADTPPVHPEMDNEICEARVGSSRHAARLLHVIRFGLDALPANPRNRRAITIGCRARNHL